ncbi:MAG: DUF2062 domain-containing protein [Hydrogenovibrio sp.]|uniref:DUF2062 domain-containing protein n=1 Tax=Hydrogenovibrio TaxID=28884 RepID=UPI0009FC3FC4|nr:MULTISPECIES: DUF2062 domain-containing protein [Hydrogenovibrio]MDR9499281.1 DUF2062 domain-containing protein [Hydrogenovibrio sp.]
MSILLQTRAPGWYNDLMVRYLKLQMHRIGRKVRQSALLNRYFPRFKDRVYWAGNRMSFARAGFIGAFCMMLPIPFQMLLGSILAYYGRANIPLATALAWITNPLTMGPIWYGGYQFGTWFLNVPDVHPSMQNLAIGSPIWFEQVFPLIWQPFFLGNLMLGVIFGSLLFALIAYLHPVRFLFNALSRRRSQR